uniref:Ig-like domain-containing protein n=1 Tax=Hippocampus comes TaxID=109280 RepID=A0A3Q2Y6Y9_HIPCM
MASRDILKDRRRPHPQLYVLFCVLTEEAAKFTKNLSNVEGTETDSVKLICEVSKPGAEVTWYQGDRELPEGGRYEQIADGRKRILIIQDLRMEDAGEYNCRLKEDQSETICRRYVSLHSFPRPPKIAASL